MGQKVLGSVFMVDSESGSDLHHNSSKEVVFGNLIVSFPPFGIIHDTLLLRHTGNSESKIVFTADCTEAPGTSTRNPKIQTQTSHAPHPYPP
jgi:hypothetical protein